MFAALASFATVILLALPSTTSAFSLAPSVTTRCSSSGSRATIMGNAIRTDTQLHVRSSDGSRDNNNDDELGRGYMISSRREALFKTAGLFLGIAATVATTTAVEPANAVDAEKTIYLTGKAPKVPGQKPKEKGDTSGTKKDPKFLRSISDCKSQCETTPGPDGYARSKEDCLSDCQDICCTTYEQCTFAIVPRI